MNTLKLIAIGIIAIFFASCKASQPTGPPSGSTPTLLPVVQILDTAQTMFLRFVDSTNGDPWKAIMLTSQWLPSQPNVSLAYSIDSTYITIILNSGLETEFSFDEADDSGNYIFRGGGHNSSDHPVLSNMSEFSLNTITNKNVLLFAADTKTLPGVATQLQNTLNRLTNSGLGLNVTVLKDGQCTYGAVENFGSYGLVIIDTHGNNHSFHVGSNLDLTPTPNSEAALQVAITSQVDAGAYNMLTSGNLEMSVSVKANPNQANWQKSVIPTGLRSLNFPSKYLNLLPSMSNTIIVGNMCYSGWMATSIPIKTTVSLGDGKFATKDTVIAVDAIGKAFTNRNLISYYGYIKDSPAGQSRPVLDSFAARMEDSLVRRLVGNVDSTGIIDLESDNQTEYFDPPHPGFYNSYELQDNLYFRQFGAIDYSYQKCGDTLVDPRDGQKYATVCIGGQQWMAQNLNYNAPGSIACDSTAGFGALFGRLYDTATYMNGAKPSTSNPSGVQGICPYGWHIPSDSEWSQLFNIFGASNHQIGDALSVNVPGYTYNMSATNASGFSATPAGFFYYGTPGGPPILSCPPALELFATSSRNTQGHMDGIQIDQTGDIQNNAIVGGSCRCVKDP